MATTSLSAGAVSRLFKDRDTSARPVLQILGLRKLASGGPANRYRLKLSDGAHFQVAMLATQLNCLVSDGKLLPHCFVRLGQYIMQNVQNNVQNNVILILLNMEIVAPPPPEGQVGDPVSVTTLAEQPQKLSQEMPDRPLGTPERPKVGGVTQHLSAGTTTSAGGADASAASGSGIRPLHGTVSSGVSARRYGAVGAAGPGVKSFRDIQAINPYQTGVWIRGRCTYKSDVRRFQNARGEGSVISFELTDGSGSIRVTSFTERAGEVDEKVHLGRVYSVGMAQVKPANERFNKSTSPFEMTLDRKSVLDEDADDGSVARIRYSFVKIADLDGVPVKGPCDVVAVVHDVGELSEIVIRSTGEPCKKRSVTLIDDSNATVELTLWRGNAETMVTDADRERHPVVALRNAARGDFGGVCLNMNRSTTLEVNPGGVPEAASLRAWYDGGGAAHGAIHTLSSSTGGVGGGGGVSGPRTTLAEAHARVRDGGAANAAFVTRACVTYVRRDRELWYASDPDTRKKVTPSGTPGVWHSESSGRDFTDDEVVHRYVCSVKLSDATGSQWVSAFDEGAVAIFGTRAADLRALHASDAAAYDAALDDALFRPLVLRVTAREDDYGGEARVRYTAARAERAGFVTEGRALLAELRAALARAPA